MNSFKKLHSWTEVKAKSPANNVEKQVSVGEGFLLAS